MSYLKSLEAPSWADEFQLNANVPQAVPQMGDPSLQLTAPPSSLDGLSSGGMSSGMAGLAGAGIGAAGQTVGTLAQIIGQKGIMDRTAEQNDLGRASSEKLAKMQLASDQGIFDSRNKAAALQSVLAALGNAGSMAQAAHDTQRYATSGGAIMNAFSPPRRR